MVDAFGRAAVRFALLYLRRRFRREIRIAVGIAAITLGAGVYLAARNVREGLAAVNNPQVSLRIIDNL